MFLSVLKCFVDVCLSRYSCLIYAPDDFDYFSIHAFDFRNFYVLFLFRFHVFVCLLTQSSEELDTDTEFEPVEDMTIETRSRCKDFFDVCLP